MSLWSQFSPFFWFLFSLAVSIAVLRELRRPDDVSLRKRRERS